MKPKVLIAIFASTIALIPALASAQAPRYKLLHIPAPPTYAVMSASPTNNGLVIGEIRNGKDTINAPDNNGYSFAFTWRPGHPMRTLKVPEGYATACANDISADGRTVVGTAALVNDGAWLSESETGVLWQSGHIKTLASLPGTANSYAAEIERNGDVIGTCETAEGPSMDTTIQTFDCKWSAPDYEPTKLHDNADTNNPGNNQASAPKAFKNTVKFTPQDDADDGTAVGYVTRSDDTIRAYIVLASGTQFDLNKCLTHPLPRGKVLTDAYQFRPHGWILGRLSTSDETDNTSGDAVLLMPVK